MVRLRTGLDTGSVISDRSLSPGFTVLAGRRIKAPGRSVSNPRRRNLTLFTIAAAICLAACATTQPEPQIITHEVLVKVPIPCLATADRDNLLAKLPGDIGPWLPDARQREGRYIERLSQYRSFADAVRAVLPACVAPPVATPRPNEVTP